MKSYLIPLLLLVVFSCSESESQSMIIPDAQEEQDPIEQEEQEEEQENINPIIFEDNFEGNGALVEYITNNESALPQVTRLESRYHALLTDNSNNITLHFNQEQGRLDAKLVEFPFEFIARNIGIGTIEDSQLGPAPDNNPFIFTGVQVHVEDFNSINSSHVVVGHRGGTEFTIEGKNTVNGNSAVNDIGRNSAPNGRADIRVVGNMDRTLTVYWQLPNLKHQSEPDSWNLYRGSGNLPGTAPNYGSSIYIGLITYAYGSNGVPFVGTCDAIQINELEP